MLDEDPGAMPLLKAVPAGDAVALALGPEGGWTPEERQQCVAAGWKPVSLGPTVLRAETAAIAAVSVVSAVYSSLGRAPIES